jgi:hypothetical protein
MPIDPGDGGPIYLETRLDRTIAEPWNATSALAFVVLVAVWLVRLRGRHRHWPFLTACLPVLALGGVGGVLYHAFRCSYVFFLLDVVPIAILALATSLYFWARLLPRRWYVVLVLPPSLMSGAIVRTDPDPWAIHPYYLVIASTILVPALLFLLWTRGRDGGWVALALACFVIALVFRSTDGWWREGWLPMGSHWLWHLFGAGATGALAEYVYRVEAQAMAVQPAECAPPVPR